MKKLFIFLALTHQGFCSEHTFTPHHASYSYKAFENMSPSEVEYFFNDFQNTYCKSFDSDMDPLESGPMFNHGVPLHSPEVLRDPATASAMLRKIDHDPCSNISSVKPIHPHFLFLSIAQNSYIWNTRKNSNLELTNQDLNNWLNLLDRDVTPPAPIAVPAPQAARIPHPVAKPTVAKPKVTSTPRASADKNPTVYNFTDNPITHDEYVKLMDLRKFVGERYLDSVGALTCDASNAFLGIHNYINEKPWSNLIKDRIIRLLFNFGTMEQILAYKEIIDKA